MKKVLCWILFVSFAPSCPFYLIAIFSSEGKNDRGPFIFLFVFSLAISLLLGHFLFVKPGRKRKQLSSQIDAANNGPLEPVQPHSTLLDPGETAYFFCHAMLYDTRIIGTERTRIGSYKSGIAVNSTRQVARDVNLAAGELVVTNQRVIFAGDRDSIIIPIQNILSASVITDGVAISNGLGNSLFRVYDAYARARFTAVIRKIRAKMQSEI